MPVEGARPSPGYVPSSCATTADAGCRPPRPRGIRLRAHGSPGEADLPVEAGARIRAKSLSGDIEICDR